MPRNFPGPKKSGKKFKYSPESVQVMEDLLEEDPEMSAEAMWEILRESWGATGLSFDLFKNN